MSVAAESASAVGADVIGGRVVVVVGKTEVPDGGIKPPTDDVYEVMDATFNYGKLGGNKTIPIDQL